MKLMFKYFVEFVQCSTHINLFHTYKFEMQFPNSRLLSTLKVKSFPYFDIRRYANSLC